MEPVTKKYKKPKNQAIEDFLQTLEEMNIPVLGRNDGLGLVSFESSDMLYYSHFTATDEGKTTISISPGFSYMKDREDGNMPAVITKIINEMKNDRNA